MAGREYDSKTVVSKLECSICLSHFRDPKLLTCFHTFCTQCLEEYVTRTATDSKFECPLCRTTIAIPVGGVRQFHSNFYIKVEDLSIEEVDCDVCENGKTSSHYCIECEEHFCVRCSIAHSKMKISREHKMVLLNDTRGKQANDTREQCTRKVAKKAFCSHHNREEIKMVCKDCNVLLCVVCKLTEHENHNSSGIAKEASERRVILSKEVVEVETTVKDLKSTIEKLEERSAEVARKLNTSNKEIDERMEQIVKQVRNDAHKMKQRILQSCTDTMHYYQTKKKLVLEKVSEREAVIVHAQNVLDVGGDLDTLDSNLLTKVQSAKSVSCLLVKSLNHLIFKQSSDNCATAYGIGRTVLTKHMFSVSEDRTIYGEATGDSCAANVLAVSASYIFAGFLDYNQLLKYNRESQVSEKSQPLPYTISHGSIFGLAFDETGNCFFSHFHSKAVYKITAGHTFGDKIRSFDSFPHGIAFMKSNVSVLGDILVCVLDAASSDISQLNISSKGYVMGVPLNSRRGSYTWRKEELPGPACIAVNSSNGLVCLGYPSGKKVTLNSTDGSLLWEFNGTTNMMRPDNFCPTSVCFFGSHCVIVTDYANNTVIRIDQDGTYVQCLVKGDGPLCIALGRDYTMYVGFLHKNITCYKTRLQNGI